jgi:hypothetical protein
MSSAGRQKSDSLSWQVYELCAAVFSHGEYGDVDTIVQPNAGIRGVISKRKRQVDVLIDARWSNSGKHRVIVDAKYRSRKIDVTRVEAFEGMMKDCRAQHE